MLNASRIRGISNLNSTESQLRFLAILHDYCKTCNPNKNPEHTCLHTQCNINHNNENREININNSSNE